jgi:hypothetical protein
MNVSVQNPKAPPRFGKAYWSRVGETFVLAGGAVFAGQWTQLQEAINVGDVQAAKKVGLAVMGGLAVALFKAIWLGFRFPAS